MKTQNSVFPRHIWMILASIGLACAGAVDVGEGVLVKDSKAEEGQELIHAYLPLLANDDDRHYRLNPLAMAAVMDSFRELAGEDYTKLKKIATGLAEEVSIFQAATPAAPGLDGFQQWLHARQANHQSAAQLSKDLHEVRSIFLRLARIGLTKKEMMYHKFAICDELREFLPDLETKEIISLVEDTSSATAKAPQPGVAAPPPPAQPAEGIPPQAKAPGAPKIPAQPVTENEPLFIPEIPAPGTAPQLPPLFPGGELQRPPMQRMYTVGKFVISYTPIP